MRRFMMKLKRYKEYISLRTGSELMPTHSNMLCLTSLRDGALCSSSISLIMSPTGKIHLVVSIQCIYLEVGVVAFMRVGSLVLGKYDSK